MANENDMRGQGSQGSENLEQGGQQKGGSQSDMQSEGQDMQSRSGQNQTEESESER